MRVAKLVQGLRDGTIVTRAENKAKREKARPDGDEAFLAFAESMWANDDDDEEEETRRRGPMHVPAPKLALPNHDESYRPPEEYLLEDDELEDHEGLVPKRHDTLRAVGAYEHAVKERFERCLDLYLCPRAMKRRLNIDPESLVPKLPDPKDLKPFPNALCRDFVGHDAPVVALACSPDGQWLAETRQTLVKTLRCGAKWISCLRVHPSGDHVAVGSRDKRLCWFDMDLGDSAYKTLKYHDKRAVDFHALPHGAESMALRSVALIAPPRVAIAIGRRQLSAAVPGVPAGAALRLLGYQICPFATR
ncbi:hypothetical protein JL720_1203 [Aureococcus anophagefferens]|nr:hypothetical protein JL720_1203 [Aureococcus anophagefferens]